MSNVGNNRTMVNGNSHIPLRRSTSKTNGTATPTKIGDETNKWKMKFEESEMKRRALIAQNEKSERERVFLFGGAWLEGREVGGWAGLIGAGIDSVGGDRDVVGVR